ncbi:UNVERIFIED_CONTAM: hypothetical protein Scaly_2051700 [Sesamum calycinum]|uniref:Retrotransposon gag domain-containing protein n=1 Tax=Sesamum calycinum TaxID=2727403 RepID=A0AAW2N5P1_9LAMI
MADELPANCRTPAVVEYDGTTDLQEHLSYFENAALLHSWKLRKIELSLFTVRQKENEPLKEYLQRFNVAALEVPSATQEVKASAFSRGLLDGNFFKSLAKKLVSKFDTLLARVVKYINMEDAQATKKESHGEKRKDTKEEAPPRNFGLISGTRSPPFPRVNANIHSTNCAHHSSPYGSRGKMPIVLKPSQEKGTRQYLVGYDTNDPPREGVIRMIARGLNGGDSHHARKSQVKKAHNITLKEVLDVEVVEDTPLIQFGRAEWLRPKNAHNDALVITTLLANYEAGRIFIRLMKLG